jgi:DNA polymerase
MPESSRHFKLAKVASDVRNCRRCAGLNIPEETESAPGYGDPSSPVVIVGQSLCGPCMASQVPFTGGSGRLLDKALEAAGVLKERVFTTNVVHCHPPGNRPSLPYEVANCREYLEQELAIVRPRLVVGLGKDAAVWLTSWVPASWEVLRSTDSLGASAQKQVLLLLPHPAYICRQPSEDRSRFIGILADAIVWAFSR